MAGTPAAVRPSECALTLHDESNSSLMRCCLARGASAQSSAWWRRSTPTRSTYCSRPARSSNGGARAMTHGRRRLRAASVCTAMDGGAGGFSHSSAGSCTCGHGRVCKLRCASALAGVCDGHRDKSRCAFVLPCSLGARRFLENGLEGSRSKASSRRCTCGRKRSMMRGRSPSSST